MTVILSPSTYAGTNISATGTIMQSIFPDGGPSLVPNPFEQRFVPVAGGWPRPLVPQATARTLTLRVHLIHDGTDAAWTAFNTLFDPAAGEQALVATDGTRTWQLNASVLSVSQNPGMAMSDLEVQLQATFGRWEAVTESSTSTGIGSVTSQAISPTVGGNVRTPAILDATPTTVKGTGNDQRYGVAVPIAWVSPVAGIDYPIAIQMDTATEVTATRMQADGDDLRVIVDNVEVQRDLGSMNAATTNVWFTVDWAPSRSATLKAAMASNVSPATGSTWDLGALADTSQLPDSGVLLIGTEAIAYTSKHANGHSLVNITRGVRATTAAAHAIADVAYWCEHDVWVIYGNTVVTAPVIDSDRTPQFDRAATASSNGQWSYDGTSGFATEGGRRPAEWTPTKYGTNLRMVTVRGQKSSATFVPLGGGTLSTGWTANTGTMVAAVDDPVGTPDDNTTYISASTNTVYATFTPQSGGLLVGIPDNALIASVAVTSRSELTVSGGASVVNVLYMPNEDLNPATTGAHALTLNVYNEFTNTWTQNVWSGLPWTTNDLKALEFGVGSSGIGSGGVIRVTQVYLTVTYAPHDSPATALGVYTDNGEYQPGFPNRDAWLLNTPAGVLGASAAVLTVVSGGVVNDGTLYGTDSYGIFQQIGHTFSGGTRHIRARPDTRLYNLLFHSPTLTTTTWAGSAMTAAVLQFDPTATPKIVVTARQDVYVHRWTLTNASDASKALSVLFVSPLNKLLTVNTNTGQVTHADAGRVTQSALSLSTSRKEWLDLVAGANSLTWSDASQGTGAVTFVVRRRDRKN